MGKTKATNGGEPQTKQGQARGRLAAARRSCRISDIPPHERPMEKMLAQGVKALSDADLLAVLLRSGGRGCNALQLAYRLLAGDIPPVGEAGRCSINEAQAATIGTPRLSGRDFLRQADVRELSQFPGIGPVKAHQIVAALELGRRVHRGEHPSDIRLNSPERVWRFLKDDLGSCAQEEMRLLLLDVKHRLIRMETVAKGGLSSMVIQPREIMRLAVRANAAGFIIAHNHPSGDPEPSRYDIESTRKIKQAGEIIGIPLHDHLIVCPSSFASVNRESELGSRGCF